MIEKIYKSFFQLSQREQLLVGSAILGALLFFVYLSFDYVYSMTQDNRRLAVVRERELMTIISDLEKYQKLTGKLNSIVEGFDKAQISFEELTGELDKVVRSSVGGANYDLKPVGEEADLSDTHKRQKYTLSLSSLTLEQMLQLVYKIEHANRPIFLERVGVSALGSTGKFKVTLELFSVGLKSV